MYIPPFPPRFLISVASLSARYKNQSCEFFPLPRTVGDQLHLWERERSRLRCSDGVMYSRFPTWLDYDHVKKHAESLGAVVWCDDQLLRLLVSPKGKRNAS